MKKILVVEDESDLREEIRDELTIAGYEVIVAKDGNEGLDYALSHKPDLVLCDIMMPGMDGNQLLEKLRYDSNANLIQFVFITALADREDIRKGMKLGADDYLTKPFTRDELLDTIHSRLSKLITIENKLQKEMNHLRKEIIDYVPHELRTPLNGILGLASYLSIIDAADIDAEKIREAGNLINESGQVLYSTLSKYLLYIQLITKPSLISSSDELNTASEIISAIGNETAKRYKRPDDLKMNIEDITLFASVSEFSIIINELLDNAFKFSESGTFVSATFLKKDSAAEFSVHNYGIVFPEGSIDKIGAFVQFERPRHEIMGSGLGLIIVKMIAGLKNGLLSISGNVENGTTVTVSLPVNK
jgi:CheY-like chemotaxis protein